VQFSYYYGLKSITERSDHHWLDEPWAKRTQWYGKNNGALAGWSETKEKGSMLPEQSEGATEVF